MYLKLTGYQQNVIRHLELFKDGLLDKAPNIMRCLTKLPVCFKVMANRCFSRESCLYPYFNIVSTSMFLSRNNNVSSCKQFEFSELECNCNFFKLWYTCEVVISHVTMKDMIPDVFSCIEYVHY